jgi:DNA-binding NtrC family response regulator
LRSVLIVDDDSAMREMMVSLLESAGIRAQAAASAEAAIDALSDSDFDVVLSDVRMPGRDGIELLGRIRELRPESPVILMTAFGSIDSAVAAMRAGAFDYLAKPFQRDEVLLVVERAFEHRALTNEVQRLRAAVDRTSSFGDLIGASPAMREIFALIRRVADTGSSVLITGESGTGKEVVARTIHFSGARAAHPFIPVNCTAIPEGLLESELFGHVRGAFTGAVATKRGLFEKAQRGTLFLDEIGDMGPSLQAKILRVLQDREVRPVGGTESIRVDVRIVAATNKDLRAEMEAGRFRRDLFYRLNVIPIAIPPLRERPEDIPPLVDFFLRKHGRGGARTLSRAALDILVRLPWEGNARELENVVERALALTDAVDLGAEHLHLPREDRVAATTTPEALVRGAAQCRLSLRELEDLYSAEVLEMVGGNKLQAARILGINRRTLYRRGERSSASQDDDGDPAASTPD